MRLDRTNTGTSAHGSVSKPSRDFGALCIQRGEGCELASGAERFDHRWRLSAALGSEDRGRIIESYDKLKTATNIVFVMDGTGNTIFNFTGRGHATAIFNRANTVVANSTAVIAFLDYDAPAGAVPGGLDKGEKAFIAAFSLAFRIAQVGGNNPSARLTVNGHSYGTLIALFQAEDPVFGKTAIISGTPGFPHGKETISAKPIYSARTGDDVVSFATHFYNHDPHTWVDGSSPVTRRLLVAGGTGYNAYYDPGCTSLNSIVAVVLGQQHPVGVENYHPCFTCFRIDVQLWGA